MSDATDRFLSAAAEAGVPVEIEHYPEGTRTATDAARAHGCEVAQIVKSLVLVADGEPLLALVSGAHRVDTGRLAAAVGASSVRMADAGEVRDATGFAIGGTPPFGHPEPLRTVIDPTLLDFDHVYAAAGTPRDTFAVDPRELVRVTGGSLVELHEQPG